jgi:hypothetical protein
VSELQAVVLNMIEQVNCELALDEGRTVSLVSRHLAWRR